jgi:hypothetical protein
MPSSLPIGGSRENCYIWVEPRAADASRGVDRDRPAREHMTRKMAGRKKELARLTERYERHDGLSDVLVDTVAMPGHAIATITIEIEGDAIEHDSISLLQAAPHRLHQGGKKRLPRL